ncbi:MAG: hypothetical protein ACKVPJ_02935, partial [Chitinophagales bacterium]
MKLILAITVLSVSSFLFSCEKDGSDSFTIDGKITGAENQRIILQTFSFPNINGSPKTTVIDT